MKIQDWAWRKETPYYMGVVQNYGSQKLFFRRAFADLSHPFAPNVKCIRIYEVEDLSRATKVHPSYMQQ